ncbi:MAG: SCO family protein [Acidobacteria bacterium]|nr:MAG: SCO family protein [Acidobacteriota bacterium]REK04590.1 MAG: SCO family protein [Acidobacteriota bacterium]
MTPLRGSRRSLTHTSRALCLSLGLVAASVSAVAAQTQTMAVSRQKVTPDPLQESNLPRELRDLGWEQKIGAPVPQDLELVDHTGQTVRLGDLIGERPVLFAPVYYECPMLCSLVLDGVVRGLKPLAFQPGADFDVIALSFDPGESADMARVSRNTALARYGKDRADGEDRAAGWHFLTGDQQSIRAMMDAVGFRYRYEEETDEYAHAGGVVLLTPEGRISRYFYGVDYAPKDLRLGLVEASQNQLGSVVDQVLLFCFQYDPEIGKYSVLTLRIIQAAGVLTVLLLAGFVIRMLWAERRQTVTA